MIDRIEHDTDEDVVSTAGHGLYDRLQESDRHRLRNVDEPFLKRGSLHGLADARRVGWHRDFLARLEGLPSASQAAPDTSDAYDAYQAGGPAPK
jgi:hypothetical protein